MPYLFRIVYDGGILWISAYQPFSVPTARFYVLAAHGIDAQVLSVELDSE